MKKSKTLIVAVLFVLGVVLLGVGGFLIYSKFFKEEPSPEGVSTGKTVSIPKQILDNKYGFLSGDPRESSQIKKLGGLWARPHPGPFLWDSMQKGENEEFSFTETDRVVKQHQDDDIGTLVTLWPFAEWDQKKRDDASDCEVSLNDEFLPRGGPFGPPTYLPRHRCNPYDWKAYQEWVKAVVERYDGDGKNDMPDLKIPIKYWEVMNEPDLSDPEGSEDSRLDFYKQDAEGYKELLIKTSEAIREADPQAKVLIAGAAGGNSRFLSFYREVFGDERTISAFDIANIHCISNDDYQSFNVEPYKRMLEEFGINKPIWVTEAEAIISDDPDVNATQTLLSTKKALELGVGKIFFTRGKFSGDKDMKPPMPEYGSPDIKPQIDGSNFEEAYRKITSQ